MFDIKKSTFGYTVYLNGLAIRVCDTEALAAEYIAQVKSGAYTNNETTTPGAH